VTDVAQSKSDVPLEASILDSAVPLESILRTEELSRRPSRPPDYEKENRALVALVSALADSPRTILQTLADRVLEVLQADSAGLSLLTKDEKRFYWAAIAGAWQPHIGGGTPRDSGPCGDVLDRNIPMLFTHWERRYPYLGPATPLAEEGLLVPFHVNGKAVGTIWAIAHTNNRKFDAEDLRLLESLGRFASAAYQAVASLIDVTERKRVEEELRRSEAYLTEAQRLSHTGSWAWNLSTGEVLWSREIYRIFGLDPERTTLNIDLIKKLRHPEDRALAEQTLEGAVRERRDFEFESRIVLPDGSIRHVRSVGRPVVNDAGVLVEFVGAVMDVTEGKMREEALRKSQADLAHVARVATLGEMSASIAHEINQPLAAAVTSASACLRWLDAQKLEEARRSASRAIAEGHRASEIIGRIRSLVKKAPPQKDWLDVNETIHEVITLARSEIQRNNIALETQLSVKVPVILADRVQLQQVTLNLMMNAIEAMSGFSEGPRELLVRSGIDESKQVVISVQDSGPGFYPESLEHLFEAFYTTKPHGLGMGLAISRSIVEAHGGRLWVTANAPRGAVFQFVLPVGSG
jgi:PAS domain S-box-containing protein